MKRVLPMLLLLFCSVAFADEPPANRYQLREPYAVDGDTLGGSVVLPLGVVLEHQRVRLLNVDTWEVRGKNKQRGKAATEYTKAAIKEGRVYLVLNGKRDRDSFGRILATVWILDDNVWRNLNAELENSKHRKGAKDGKEETDTQIKDESNRTTLEGTVRRRRGRDNVLPPIPFSRLP